MIMLRGLLLLLLLATPAFGDQVLQQVLEEAIEKHDIPAMATVIMQGDEVTASAVAGTRVRGEDAPATLDDYWHLGSCTKAMTATMAARLVEKDVIDWNTTIADALPDLVDTMHEEYRAVTLAQLLQHRGGIPGNLIGSLEWQRAWSRDGSSQEQQQAFVKDVLAMKPIGPVGEFVYSNQGYAIAGYMCAVAAGKTYEDLMQSEIFGPLEMMSVGWGAPLTRGPNQPNGHIASGSPSDPHVDNPIAISAAGRVHCTMADWARFVASHQQRGEDDEPLLSPDSFANLHRPYPDPGNPYAMGWIEAQWAGGNGTVLTHDGSNSMFYCTVWVDPEQDFAVLVACNQGGNAAAAACGQVAITSIMRLLAAPSPEPALQR